MHTSKTLYFALDQKRMNSILDTYPGEDFFLCVNDNTAKECSPQKTRKGEKTSRLDEVTNFNHNLLFYTEKTHIASYIIRKINGVVKAHFFLLKKNEHHLIFLISPSCELVY